MNVIEHVNKVVEPFLRNKRICEQKAHRNIRGVHSWFLFKPNALNKVTFKILTPVCNVCNGVVYVYCNTSLSNNCCIFSRNTTTGMLISWSDIQESSRDSVIPKLL